MRAALARPFGARGSSRCKHSVLAVHYQHTAGDCKAVCPLAGITNKSFVAD